MVVYVAAHTTYIAPMIAHRLSQHHEEEAILLVSSNPRWGAITQTFSHVENLEKFGVFSRVVPVDTYPGSPSMDDLEENIEKAIMDGFDRTFALLNIDLRMAMVVAMTDTEGEIGVYLSLKGVTYYLLEMFPNQFYRQSNFAYEIIAKNKSKSYSNVLKKHNVLTAQNLYAVPILCHDSHDSAKMLAEKEQILFFDHQAAYDSISPEDGKRIVKSYDFQWTPPTESKTCLIVMQSYPHAYMGMERTPRLRTLYMGASQADIYFYTAQLAMDYCVDSNCMIYLKTHPNTILPNEQVRDIFGDYVKSLGIMPIDFYHCVPAIYEYQFDLILCFGSMANAKLNGTFKESIMLTYDYWCSFHLYHRLFAGIALIQACISEPQRLMWRGFKLTQLEVILKRFGWKETVNHLDDLKFIPDNAVIMVDLVNEPDKLIEGLLRAPYNTLIVFLNFNESFDFYDVSHPELLSYLVPIVISKTKTRSSTIDHMMDEVIYVFSKNKVWLQAAKQFSLSKDLPRVGIHIDAGIASESTRELIESKMIIASQTKLINKLRKWKEELVQFVNK